MKTKILVSISVLSLMTSCLRTPYDDLFVFNFTNHQIIIEGFSVEYSQKINRPLWNQSITIEPHSTYFVRNHRGEHYDTPGLFEREEIDSVNIIFDNKKIITYTCYSFSDTSCNEYRNIISWPSSFTVNCGKHNECTYVYNITEEDYANADTLK